MMLTVTGDNEKGPLSAPILASMRILVNHEWAMRSCEYRRNAGIVVAVHLENFYLKSCYELFLELVRHSSSGTTGKKFTGIGIYTIKQGRNGSLSLCAWEPGKSSGIDWTKEIGKKTL